MGEARNRAATLAVACVALAVGGCRDDNPCAIEGCTGSGLFLLKAENEGDEPMKVVVDGADRGTAEPGDRVCLELRASDRHTTEFHWEDGAVACSGADTTANSECDAVSITCDATR